MLATQPLLSPPLQARPLLWVPGVGGGAAGPPPPPPLTAVLTVTQDDADTISVSGQSSSGGTAPLTAVVVHDHNGTPTEIYNGPVEDCFITGNMELTFGSVEWVVAGTPLGTPPADGVNFLYLTVTDATMATAQDNTGQFTLTFNDPGYTLSVP